MSLDTYRVQCARGHDPLELTGQAALDHAQECTGRKLGTVPAGLGFARYVTWRSPLSRVKALPWKAPRQAQLSAAVLEAMRFGDVTLEASDGFIQPSELVVGDTFRAGTKVYTLTASEGDSVTVKMHKSKRQPERVMVLPRSDLAARVEKVVAATGTPLLLLKRAA